MDVLSLHLKVIRLVNFLLRTFYYNKTNLRRLFTMEQEWNLPIQTHYDLSNKESQSCSSKEDISLSLSSIFKPTQRFPLGFSPPLLPRMTCGCRGGSVCQCWQWGKASTQHALSQVLWAPPDLWGCCCLLSTSLIPLPQISRPKHSTLCVC